MVLKKPKPVLDEDDTPWLFTYADMVTLLFTFFVLLYSISSPDPVKIQLISSYFSKDKKMTFTELQQKIENYIVDNQVQQNVAVKLTSKGVEINFKDKVLFDTGQAELKNVAYPILSEIGNLLKYEDIKDRKISIEGHTDSIPIKSQMYPSNWELSSARASNVVRFLISQNMNYRRFEATGYADTRPIIVEDKSNRGLAQNRRVVIVISPESYMADMARTEIDINVDAVNKVAKAADIKPKSDSTGSKDKSKSPVRITVPTDTEMLEMKKFFNKAREEFIKGNFKQAIFLWQGVLKIDPDHKQSLAYIKRAKDNILASNVLHD